MAKRIPIRDMAQMTNEAVELLRQTHAEGTKLFSGTPFEPEKFEIALAVEQHRWHWKPKKVNLILVAESHVFTSAEDMNLAIDDSKIKRILRRNAVLPPSDFVRLVYCLGYGETELFENGVPKFSNYGTPLYWDLFGRVTFRGTQPRLEDGFEFSDKIKWKVETLRELFRMGIWLIDASVHAVYRRNGDRLDAALQRKLHEQWLKGYGGFLITHCNVPTLWVIGRMVQKFLPKTKDFPFKNWIYQPNAKEVDLNRNWSRLLEDCWALREAKLKF